MKKVIVILALAVAIAGFSCSSRETAPCSSSSLIGKWKIDSVHTPDSSSIGALMMAMVFSDSSTHHLEFTSDSVTINGSDSLEVSAYEIDAENKLRIAKEKDAYSYQCVSDSSVKLTASDSTVLLLIKK